MKTTLIAVLFIMCAAVIPLSAAEMAVGQDIRNTPVTVTLIIDGSKSLSGVADDVNSYLSGSLIDKILQNGDRLYIWSAGKTAQIMYSDTIKSADDRENIKKVLKNMPSAGDSADFSTALQNTASQKFGQNMHYTILISTSYTAFSPTLLGSSAELLRFSRVEEHSGWRMLVIATDINDKVRQAASAYFSGK
ncbi:MAG: hypothetical protein FWF29_04810 [Treponema sp.]|nr:hypothetical protein [Treponema sp.]